MWGRLSRLGGVAIVSLGVVVATGHPAITPGAYLPEVELTATALFMGGLGYEDVEPELIKRVLSGRYANEEHLQGIPWPGQNAPFNGTLTLNQSVEVGIENMMQAIRTTEGEKIVGGASGSTLVVDEVMRRLADDPTAPPKNELSFVVLGDANRGVFKQIRGVTLPVFEYTVPEIPVTKYDVLVVTGEYDGMGDWPDRSWNLLAVLNAMAGTGLLQQVLPEDIVDQYKLDAWGSVHYDAMFADLSTVPAQNITVRTNTLGGTTTTYLVPTADLPLLRPLKPLGVPDDVVDALETVLRPIIDSAYLRNRVRFVPPLRPFGGAATSAPSAARTTAAVPAPARARAGTPSRRPNATASVRAAAQRPAGSVPTVAGRG